MPLHLYHGPKSHKKDQKFLALVHSLPLQSLVITQNANAVQHLQTQNTKAKVQSLPDFLMQLLKLQLHRAHYADSFLCQQLIFSLFENETPGWILKQPNALKSLNDIHALFLQIKKSFGLHKQQNNFGLPLSDNTVYTLYAKYNDHLHSQHFYDDGDLIAKNLEAFNHSNATWPLPYETLILQNIYPLGPGERSLIRLCLKKFPNLTWHIFYDEDFNNPSDLLSLAYEELGELAQTSEFVAPNTKSAHALNLAPNPINEMQWAISEVQNAIQNDSTLDQHALVCPQEYAAPLCRLLKAEKIPFRSFFKTNLTELVPTHTLATKLNGSSQAATIEETLAKHALEDINNQFEFAKNLFLSLTQNVSQTSWQALWQLYIENSKLSQKASSHQLVVIPYEEALHFTNRNVIAIGLQLENFLTFNETSVLNAFELSHKEWAEPLGLPQYQFRIRFAKLEQFLNAATSLKLARSLTDFTGKPTSAIPNLNFTTHDLNRVEKVYSSPAKPFTNFYQQNSFSVSEIQRYRDCPYKYFASSVLKLKPVEEPDVEIDAMNLGNLLHNTLNELVNQNLCSYQNYIQNQLPQESWKSILQATLDSQASQIEELKDKPKHISSTILQKAYQSLLNFNQTEQEWFKNSTKQTLPNLSEWAFQLKIGSSTLHGRIDRIDTNPNRSYFSVIDYKTGSTPSAPEMKTGLDLQIPIYLMAVEKLLYPEALPSAGIYYSLKKESSAQLVFAESPDAMLTKTKHLHYSREEWLSLRESLLTQIATIINQIQDNQFAPNPKNEMLCQHCDFKRMCGKFDLSI